MDTDSPNAAWFRAMKWATLANDVDYVRESLDLKLFREGVRHKRDELGDRLGDSPEASMVRVHARAALGALDHLASSLENLANLIDPDAQAGS